MSADATTRDVLEGRARWCVITGDCLAIMPTIERVDHVITDPPYEAEAHTTQRRVKASACRGHKWSRTGGVTVVEPLAFEPIKPTERRTVGYQIARVAARWSVVFCQVEAAMHWRDALMGDEFGVNGVTYRRTCVWVKPDGQPQLSGDRPGMGYESIVVCHRVGRSRWNGGGRCGVFTHIKQDNGGRPNDHPTTKPVPLIQELVELFTDPDEIILDPFCGSGTTGVAALRLGRRAILIEKDPKYAAIARERMEAETAGSTLQAARAGQLPLLGGAR